MERHTRGGSTSSHDARGAVQTNPRGQRNGMPSSRLYVPAAGDDALAARAWNRVAAIQATLRGMPPPAPIAEPWSKGACEGCGWRFCCDCPPEAQAQALKAAPGGAGSGE